MRALFDSENGFFLFFIWVHAILNTPSIKCYLNSAFKRRECEKRLPLKTAYSWNSVLKRKFNSVIKWFNDTSMWQARTG